MITQISANTSFRGLLILGCLLIPLLSFCQQTLQAKFEAIESNIKGNLGVNVLLIETGESVSLNGNKQFPMQSVYKFPIAMVMLKQVDQGKFSLEDTIQIDKAEYIPKQGYSPIREKFPEGARLTLKEIIRYNIESDGT
ncbi:MAG: serine hydrolase, partial [Bacteroidota bacterium]